MNKTTISLEVNGEHLQLASGTTVKTVITRVTLSEKGIAVALNGEVLPKTSWAATTLCSGDRLEVLSAAAGG